MPNIQRLSAHLANLIAAGEVVERPASVVKELLENAVDAGANSVTVEIQNGGMTFIRVTDNGCGMSREDAEVAFLRHATSKLHTEEELAAIGTLGFRGEALAAIAAVSRIDLLTSDGSEGSSMHLEAGAIVRREEAGCPRGTTIIVRDLFYNTPARLKFMKRDAAEGAQVHAVVQRQALANPAVRYRFLRDGQEVLVTSGDGELHSAIYAVLGRQLAMDMVEVSGRWDNMLLSGYVTRPTATRGNRNAQHFFVNGRYIRSRLMTAALEEAYQNQLAVGRFPGCVLHLHLPLQQVDVNVHPAKTEVKFLMEQSVYDAVRYGVLAALNRTPGRPEAKLTHAEPMAQAADRDATAMPARQAVSMAAPRSAAPSARPGFYRSMSSEDYRAMAQSLADRPPVPAAPTLQQQVQSSQSTVGVQLPFGGSVERERPAMVASPKPAYYSRAESIPSEPQRVSVPAQKTEVSKVEQNLPFASDLEQQTMSELPPEQTWRLVGEILQTYLVIEEPDGMLLIDKHAAHERILFEKMRAQQIPMMSQTLLEPLNANLNIEEQEAVLAQQALLQSFGYAWNAEGMLTQIPADLNVEEALVDLQKLASHLLEGHQPDPTAMRDIALHTIACKAAVKAGEISGEAERLALAREVLSRDDIKYCPHGRPVCISLSRATIERQFGRA